jgi:hypothetical protein
VPAGRLETRLTDTTDTFSGKIESPRAACEIGRTIIVTHAGVTIATATTDPAGNWTVVGPRPPKNDDVTAFTPKKVLKKEGAVASRPPAIRRCHLARAGSS